MDYRLTSPHKIDASIQLPPSKSVAARAVVINAIQGIVPVIPPGACDDVNIIASALLGSDYHINVGASGTAMRFLTAYYAVHQGQNVIIDGSDHLRQRPIAPLVDALRCMGADITYLDKEGFPPLQITGKRLSADIVSIDGSLSSQYVSALLMIAPTVGGFTLDIKGTAVSRPYIDLTVDMMRKAGTEVSNGEGQIMVADKPYCNKLNPLADADWSAAVYWFAWQALLPDSHIVLKGLRTGSSQADEGILSLSSALGVTANWIGEDLHLTGGNQYKVPLKLDMRAMPDMVPAIVVALCLKNNPFTISGVQNLRIKESDRIAALQQELAKLGYILHTPDASTITYDGSTMPVSNTIIDTHNDHRIAMAMALAATRHHDITITNAQVVAKSYPHHWRDLTAALNRTRTEEQDKLVVGRIVAG